MSTSETTAQTLAGLIATGNRLADSPQAGYSARVPGATDRRWVRLLPHALILLPVVAEYARALVGGEFFLEVYRNEVLPHWQAMGQALSDGRLLHWTPNAMCGYPLLANPQTGGLYPLHVALAGWIDVDRLLTWSAFGHALFAGYGARALATQLGVSALGAGLAGGLFASSPYLAFHHQTVHGLVTLSWLPWFLTAVLRASASQGHALGPRAGRWAWAALALALSLYGGHIQHSMYATLAAGGLVLAAPDAQTPWRARLVRLGWLSLSVGVALVLYAPVLLPALHLHGASLRATLTASEVAAHAAIETFGWDDLVEVVAPRFFGGPSFRDFWYPEFLGAGVLFLAWLGGRRRDRAANVVFVGLLALLGILVLAAIPGTRELLASIPGVRAFRATGRLFALVLLATAILAARGLDVLDVRTGAIGTGALMAVSGGVLALGLTDGVVGREPELSAARLSQYRFGDGLLLLATGSLLLLSALLPRARRWLTLAAALGPIVLTGVRSVPTLPAGAIVEPPLAALLRRAGTGRVLGIAAGDENAMAAVPAPEGWPDSGRGDPRRATHALPASVGAGLGLAELHSETSLPLRRVVRRVFGERVRALDYPFQAHPEIGLGLLRHLGVTHLIAPVNGQMPVRPRPRMRVQLGGIGLFDLGTPRPFARFYPDRLCRSVSTEEEALAEVDRDGEAPDVPLVVEAAGYGGESDGLGGLPVAATARRESASEIQVTVEAPSDGVLLVMEAFDPGWMAEVDGQPSRVIPADAAFLGVALTAGAHQVRLRYTPPGFALGLAGLAVGLLAVGAALVAARRAREP